MRLPVESCFTNLFSFNCDVSWGFNAYLESPRFKVDYDLDVVTDIDRFILFDANDEHEFSLRREIVLPTELVESFAGDLLAARTDRRCFKLIVSITIP